MASKGEMKYSLLVFLKHIHAKFFIQVALAGSRAFVAAK
jgi:hypothetical protein